MRQVKGALGGGAADALVGAATGCAVGLLKEDVSDTAGKVTARTWSWLPYSFNKGLPATFCSAYYSSPQWRTASSDTDGGENEMLNAWRLVASVVVVGAAIATGFMLPTNINIEV